MIKPEFFDDPDIGELTLGARLLFIGLWTQADREGRLVDDLRRLKVRLFAWDVLDIEALASELHRTDLIRRYQDANGNRFMWIRNFVKHQRPHPKEPASVIPLCGANTGQYHGEPCKNTANPSESGSLILDSGTRNLESEGEPRKNTAPAAPSALVPTRAQDLIDLWNATTRPPLPKCEKLTDGRRALIKKRLADRPLQEWRDVFEALQAIPFYLGDNPRGWVADFDFIIKNDTASAKVLEKHRTPASPISAVSQGNVAALKSLVHRTGGRT